MNIINYWYVVVDHTNSCIVRTCKYKSKINAVIVKFSEVPVNRVIFRIKILVLVAVLDLDGNASLLFICHDCYQHSTPHFHHSDATSISVTDDMHLWVNLVWKWNCSTKTFVHFLKNRNINTRRYASLMAASFHLAFQVRILHKSTRTVRNNSSLLQPW